jgi:hypothetical protein
MTDNKPNPLPQLTPTGNKKAIIFAVVATALITAVVVGAGTLLYVTWSNTKNSNINSTTSTTNTTENQNSNNYTANTNTANQNIAVTNANTTTNNNTNAITGIITPKSYSLVSYPLSESPINGKFSTEPITGNLTCYDEYWADAKDTRLVLNGGLVVIPSLNQLITTYENIKPECNLITEIFSIPTEGQFLYLKTWHTYPRDGSPTITGIYRVNLSDNSLSLYLNIYCSFNLFSSACAEDFSINGANVSGYFLTISK